MPHTLIDDADPDSLISRLSRPLASAADREAFRAAARDALAHVPVHGEGSNYRALKELQRLYFQPPTDGRHWDRPSKLRDGPPIEHGDLRRVPRKQR